MLAQRAMQQTLRRVAASKPSIASQMGFRKAVAPMAVSSMIQTRPVTTQQITPKDSHEILAAQRKLRPNSPHLTIYKWPLAMTMSITHRATGGLISGGMYVFALSYLAAPLFGWHLDSATLAATFASWPLLAQYAAKFAVAMPFAFHSVNGLRHLVWDTASQLKKQQVVNSGLGILGVSAVSALCLTFLL